MAKLISTNPAKNYKVLGSANVSTLQEIKRKVADAQRAKTHWKELGVEKRTELLRPIFSEFMKRKKELAVLITKEIGKPIKESLDDIAWNEDYFKWFLENGKKYLSDEITFENNKSIHKIIYEPIGVAAVIVPWNFPFDMFLWGVIPNLIAGNTVVFKHSEECPLTGKLIEQVMNKSGLPKGIFSQVYGDGEVGGESQEAKIAVAWTIRNRVEDSQKRWGQTYHEVTLSPSQYDAFMKTKIVLIAVLIILLFSFSRRQLSSPTEEFKQQAKFLENGCPVSKDQLWIRGRAMDCKTSPNSQFIAKIIYNGYEPQKKYYELFILDLEKKNEWKIFEGDYHTMSLDWTRQNQIKIKWDCGSGCLSSKVIGLNENISIADYQNGGMNEENDWQTQFSEGR